MAKGRNIINALAKGEYNEKQLSIRHRSFMDLVVRDKVFVDTNFSLALLSNVTFINCNFMGCLFNNARIKNCSFKNCRFEDCQIRYAQLIESTFIDCFLSSSDLRVSSWGRLNFYSSRLDNIKLNRFCASDCAFNDCTLNNVIFSEDPAEAPYAGCKNIVFSRCNMHNINFKGVRQQNIYLTNTDMTTLENVTGLQSNMPLDIMNTFERTDEGFIVYKTFGQFYKPSTNWEIKEGAIIEETVDRGLENCGAGINVGSLKWVRENTSPQGEFGLWKCLIRYEWSPGIIIPTDSEGKIRAQKVQLLYEVDPYGDKINNQGV